MLQQKSDSLFIHQATLHRVSNENSLKINEIIVKVVIITNLEQKQKSALC